MIPQRRAAMLIDVLAALAILGSTVVALLMVQSKAIANVAAVQRKTTAATLATELLATWHLAEVDLGEADDGLFEDRAGWSWRRAASDGLGLDAGALTEVTLTIVHQGDAYEQRTIASYCWLEPPDDADAR